MLRGVLMTFHVFLELEPPVSFSLLVFALLQQTLKTSTKLGSLKTIQFLRPDGALREKADTHSGQTQRPGPQEGLVPSSPPPYGLGSSPTSVDTSVALGQRLDFSVLLLLSSKLLRRLKCIKHLMGAWHGDYLGNPHCYFLHILPPLPKFPLSDDSKAPPCWEQREQRVNG